MPSFARIFQQHLGLWERLKHQLSLSKLHFMSTTTKKSRPTPIDISRAAIYPTKEKTATISAKRPFMKLEESGTGKPLGSLDQRFEMGDLQSVETHIKGEKHGTVHDDGICLRHDLEHTWSPMNAAKIT